ncbi:MAG: thiolase family protein [Myxococcales bacterium]|nr:thiolase family protein [Myxococcales bacterium]
MRDVYVVAAGMIPFGRHEDAGIKQLTGRALEALFKDSPVGKEALEAAWFSNSGWGIGSMDPEALPNVAQPCIRGQVALAPSGIDGIPIINVENACASGSTAFNNAYMGVGSGMFDVALAVGAEKMSVPKDADAETKKRSLGSMIAGTDVEVMTAAMGAIREAAEKKRKEAEARGEVKQKKQRENRSPFMDFYSALARAHMEQYGTTVEQIAAIAAKNHNQGALNPYAQYRFKMTVQEVLDDDEVSFPLTRAMCSPTGDGAAACILVSGDYLKKLGQVRPVKVRASVLGSSKMNTSGAQRAKELAQLAYEKAGVGPEDIDMAEVHDATAVGELLQYENLLLCPEGEGGRFAESGASALGGKCPVNPCGGLESKGHPIGATGLAMVAECFWQLRGDAGERQVEGARLAMIENGGGFLGQGEAAIVMNILEGPSS